MKPKYKNFTDKEIQEMVKRNISFLQLQREMGYSDKGGSATERIRKMLDKKDIDYSHFKGYAWNKKSDIPSNLTLKKELIKKRGYRCEKCGLSEWFGVPIILELHHEDGNKNNVDDNNLKLLCPNCHSQTDNWRGKNTKNQISDEEFLEALLNTPNINQACLKLGIPANQRNYLRARELLKSID
jgi:ssDNA-binding Zn-finger/Zn-ribbon topoisomerase 1